MQILLLLLALTTNALSQSLSLPPLTGPLRVGTTTLELLDTTHSPPRDLMVSVFYPAKPPHHHQLAKVFTPLYSNFLETTLGLPSGLASTVLSQAYLNAPLKCNTIKNKQPDVVLFSPGYGGSRVDYTATLENLASLGYLVIGVDHPNDTAFIDYPDGRVDFHVPIDLNTTTAAPAVDIRVQDLRFVLDILGKNDSLARKIPGVKGKLDTKKVAIFGHSLGGAAAASSMLADKRFACGANLDGALLGHVVEKGVEGPFLIVAAEGHNRSNDDSWRSFWRNSKGWEREVSVRGARHGTFSDQAVWYGYLRELGLIAEVPEELFGTIDGERMLEIESAYLGAFFGTCFSDKRGEPKTPKLLQGPSKRFPEVSFWTR